MLTSERRERANILLGLKANNKNTLEYRSIE